MKYETPAMFVVLLLLTCGISTIGAYAEDEDSEDRLGFGVQEREREQEHRDDESSPFSGTILYVTIGAIAAAIAYTAFKIARPRKTAKMQ